MTKKCVSPRGAYRRRRRRCRTSERAQLNDVLLLKNEQKNQRRHKLILTFARCKNARSVGLFAYARAHEKERVRTNLRQRWQTRARTLWHKRCARGQSRNTRDNRRIAAIAERTLLIMQCNSNGINTRARAHRH